MELLHVRAIRALREAETLGDLSLPPLIRAALDDLIPEALPDDFFYRLVRVEEELRRPGQPRRAFRDQLIRDLFKLYRRVGFDTSHGPMSQKAALKRLYDEFGAKNGWNSTDPIRKILKRPNDILVRKSRVHKSDLDNLVSWIQTEVERAGK